ncbi:auxin-induced protein 6B-like [Aristolochia californica]|uniref:auxin-induced protein 6B-like n=1 Tax=Aristolochia californica TaxID=171875 RepID=UPI0035E28039
MASAFKKVDKIRQIVQLKQLMRRWKALSLRRRSGVSQIDDSDSESVATPRKIPPGFLAVYVGPERRRFVIPTRYLNLPVFSSLLKMAEEEFGFQSRGGLVLPCEVDIFKGVLRILEKDEQRFCRLDLDDVLELFAEVGLDTCKEGSKSAHAFSPLLQKTRV